MMLPEPRIVEELSWTESGLPQKERTRRDLNTIGFKSVTTAVSNSLKVWLEHLGTVKVMLERFELGIRYIYNVESILVS